jgi:hypothetical protein
VRNGAEIPTSVPYLEALRRWIKESGTGIAKIIASVAGHSVDYVYRFYCDDETDRRKMSVETLLLATQISKDTRMLDWIEAQCGRAAFTLPVGSAVGGVTQVATVLREAAECASTVLTANADSVMTDSEREKCNKEIHEAMAALASLRAWVNAGSCVKAAAPQRN